MIYVVKIQFKYLIHRFRSLDRRDTIKCNDGMSIVKVNLLSTDSQLVFPYLEAVISKYH